MRRTAGLLTALVLVLGLPVAADDGDVVLGRWLTAPSDDGRAHVEIFKDKGVEDVLILGGGIVPEEDVARMKESGIQEIFGPGTRTDDIVEYIKGNLKK